MKSGKRGTEGPRSLGLQNMPIIRSITSVGAIMVNHHILRVPERRTERFTMTLERSELGRRADIAFRKTWDDVLDGVPIQS